MKMGSIMIQGRRILAPAAMAVLLALTLITSPAHAVEACSAQNCAACKTDLNGDGKATMADLQVLRKCVVSRCGDPGYDVNGDGTVDKTDQKILASCIK